jgi:hypothetical protein
MLPRSLQKVALFLILLAGTPAMAVEEPRYEVIESQRDFELRRYEPMLIAETQVSGDRDEASRAGFRLLADFIFGNNQVAGQDGSAKIAMTAPVTQEAASSKIAMTAPVTVEPQTGGAGLWRIHFVMPGQYTLATIPKPRNPAVQLRELPRQWYAVHRFSGFATDSRVETKTREALDWIEQKKLKAIGSPQLARYDPPWTLPMFRRNEILIPVAPPEAKGAQ